MSFLERTSFACLNRSMEKDLNKSEKRQEKKTYKSPSLTRYGKIASLTAGGSGMMQEMAVMMGMGMGGVNRFP